MIVHFKAGVLRTLAGLLLCWFPSDGLLLLTRTGQDKMAVSALAERVLRPTGI